MKKLADWREKGDRILKTLFESPDGFSGEYARFYIAARLRVCPKTLSLIAKFSYHQTN